MVKEKNGNSIPDNSNLPKLNFAGLCSLSPIADALPFPDAIDEPENLIANLNATKSQNDENVISNLISALSTHSRPPFKSGLSSFEIEDSFDERNIESITGKLAQQVIQACPTLLERKNQSSAKAIQDEKAKKRAKKEKKHKRERDHSTNGDIENGFKHKKHKSKDKIEKAEAKAEKKRLKKEEKREKRRRKEIDDSNTDSDASPIKHHRTDSKVEPMEVDQVKKSLFPIDPKYECSVSIYNCNDDDIQELQPRHTESKEEKYARIEREKKKAKVEAEKRKQHKELTRQLHEKMDEEEKSQMTKRFRNLIETALDRFRNADLAEIDQEDSSLLLEEFQLKNIANEAAKLKNINAIKDIKKKRLQRMCQLMEVNMRQGCRHALFPPKDKQQDDDLSRQERIAAINCALEAGLCVMYVLTSPDISPSLISDNVIDRTIELVRFQLNHSIYPEFDPVYRSSLKIKSDKQKRAQNKITNHSSSVLRLFTRVADLLSLIGELAGQTTLIDSMVLKISSVSISPFFVENIQKIQLAAIKCATVLFAKYGDHRRHLLDDILSSLARLPTTKRNLRNYRLSHLQDDDDDDVTCIQMISALVLQLVQSVAKIPPPVNTDIRQSAFDGGAIAQEKLSAANVDENQILSSLDLTDQIQKLFLTIFLDKISGKKEEIDYRPLFENFIQDLLSTVNKPEWPAAGEMLTILGKMLVRNFLNRKVDISLRTASLEYLGVVAARLRKDALTSEKDVADVRPIVAIVDHGVEGMEEETESSLLRRQLQMIVVQHLNAGKKVDSALDFSLNFTIAQWVKDLAIEQDGMKSDPLPTELNQLRYKRDHIHQMMNYPPIKDLELSYDDICIISRYLSKDRMFNKSFDMYLKQILSVSNEPAVQIRTKALKCLTEIVSVDPKILSQELIAKSIQRRMQDMATSVREAAVDLIGKFILTRPEVAEQYYKMLTERILDTGVSVRKRVIKILRDLCLEVKDFPFIGNACIRIIKRVNDDEEGIKKLVLEVFSKLWFTPIEENELDPESWKQQLNMKARTVMDVVAACPDVEWLQDLMKGLIDGNNGDSYSQDAVESCEQLAKCISEKILKPDPDMDKKRLVACFTTLLLIANVRPGLVTHHVKLLHPYLNFKIKTAHDLQIVIKTEKILELTVPLMHHPSADWLKLLEMDLMKIIMFSANEAIEGAIACLGALVNKVSKKYSVVWECFSKYYQFVKRIVDQDNVEETMQSTKKVIFLRSIQTIGYLHKTFDFDQKEIVEAKNVTFNIKEETYEKLLSLVPIEMLDLQTNVLASLGHLMVQEPSFMLLEMTKALYDGVLTSENDKLRCVVLNNFDNYLKEEDKRLSELERQNVKDKNKDSGQKDGQKISSKSINNKEVKKDENEKNEDVEKPKPVVENIKQMQDVRSSQASAVIQLFLRQIQEAYISNDVAVRKACLGVIVKVQNQGLVAPLGLLHTLIAASADPKVPALRTQADHVMHEVNKRQTVIHVAALKGLREAFKVCRTVCGGIMLSEEDDALAQYTESIPRGFLIGEYGKTASCCHLYSLLKDKKYKRNFVTQLLSIFDDSRIQLDYLLYVADNLAWFPHSSVDEVLFIIKIADTKINGTGNDVLHTFKSRMKPKNGESQMEVDSNGKPEESDSEDEDDPEDEEVIDKIRERLPDDEEVLNEFLVRSLAIFMLLRLRIYLKQAYNLSDKRIESYANDGSSDQSKAKPCVRKTGPCFEPMEVIQYLNNFNSEDSHYEMRDETIKIYLKLKQLMYEIDDIDESSDEEGNKPPKPKSKTGITAQLEVEAKELQKKEAKKKEKENIEDDSDRDTDGEEKKADILDRARKQIHKKASKDKKKKRRRRIAENDDSSGSDFNPFS